MGRRKGVRSLNRPSHGKPGDGWGGSRTNALLSPGHLQRPDGKVHPMVNPVREQAPHYHHAGLQDAKAKAGPVPSLTGVGMICCLEIGALFISFVCAGRLVTTTTIPSFFSTLPYKSRGKARQDISQHSSSRSSCLSEDRGDSISSPAPSSVGGPRYILSRSQRLRSWWHDHPTPTPVCCLSPCVT